MRRRCRTSHLFISLLHISFYKHFTYGVLFINLFLTCKDVYNGARVSSKTLVPEKERQRKMRRKRKEEKTREEEKKD